MLLRTSSSLSLLNTNADHFLPLLNSCSTRAKSFVSCATKGSNNRPLTGVVFEPFEEVKKELDLVPTVPQASLARQKYTDECESVINEQIKCVSLFPSFSSFFFYFALIFIYSIYTHLSTLCFSNKTEIFMFYVCLGRINLYTGLTGKGKIS